MENIHIDSLTKIYNENYLRSNYQSYLKENPISNFIMIDFEKFKNINDIYGHDVGDIYLKVFANILNYCFKDSIVVRLHGDEFAILTKYSEDRISKLFEIVDDKISLAVLEEKIPQIFKYNSGSSEALDNIEETIKKADYIMYYAKKHRINYQRYSSSIYNEKIMEDDFLIKVNTFLKDDDFSYTVRPLYNLDGRKEAIYQIYTKEKDGTAIFNQGRYNILKKSSKLQQLDLYNIKNLLQEEVLNYSKIILIIDCNSLISDRILIDYLIFSKELLNNVIFSIDISGVDSKNNKLIIDRINELKRNNINIILDKFDSSICDLIWEECDINCIKISDSYWKKAMHNEKVYFSLKAKLEAFKNLKIRTIFAYIETEEEYNFLKQFSFADTLFSGDYFSKEEKLSLKKQM